MKFSQVNIGQKFLCKIGKVEYVKVSSETALCISGDYIDSIPDAFSPNSKVELVN